MKSKIKPKKITAMIIGAALAVSVAAGATACKNGSGNSGSLGTTDLNLSDYAAEYESGGSEKGYSSVKEVASKTESGVLTVQKADGHGVPLYGFSANLSLFDLITEKVLFTSRLNALIANLQSDWLGYQEPYGEFVNVLKVWTVRSNSESYHAGELEVYACDGTEILAAAKYGELTCRATSGLYVGDDTEPCTVYAITGTKISGSDTENETSEAVEVYLKENYDGETGAVAGYSVISKSDVKVYGPDYSEGEDASGVLKNIYADGKDYPVEGAIKDYKYSLIGNKITFYNGAAKTGTVELTGNGEMLGFVGDYLYYSEKTPVVSEALSDYNMLVQVTDGGKVQDFKYNYSLYKYDVLQDRTTKLDYDVVVTDMQSVYNRETKTYDAAVINGVKMTDGVATTIIGSGRAISLGSDTFTYWVDCDLKIGYDITGMFESAPEIYSLGNGNYYACENGSGYIVDGDFNVIKVNVSEGAINIGEGLVRFSRDGYVGYTDLNGKIVIAPQFTSIDGVFYNGITSGTDAFNERVLINKDGTVTRIADVENSTESGYDKSVEVKEGFYKVVTVNGTENTTKVEYFSFEGKLLKSFSHGYVIEISGGFIQENQVDRYGFPVGEYVYYKLV